MEQENDTKKELEYLWLYDEETKKQVKCFLKYRYCIYLDEDAELKWIDTVFTQWKDKNVYCFVFDPFWLVAKNPVRGWVVFNTQNVKNYPVTSLKPCIIIKQDVDNNCSSCYCYSYLSNTIDLALSIKEDALNTLMKQEKPFIV